MSEAMIPFIHKGMLSNTGIMVPSEKQGFQKPGIAIAW
jgi:hypothetical protein